MRNILERFKDIFKNRIFVLLLFSVIAFAILSIRLFSLQIIQGEEIQNKLTTSVMQTLTVPATRGGIYDRFGKPLAVNTAAFSVKIDDSVTASPENKNYYLLSLVKDLDLKGDIYDSLPLSKTAPLSFTFETKEEEIKWKESVGLKDEQLDFSAEETLNYLFSLYELPENASDSIKRKAVSLGISCSNKNLMVAFLVSTLENNNETLVDELPISKEKPYSFTFTNEAEETSWKASVGMSSDEYGLTANETINYLKSYFGIPDNFSDRMTREILSVRYSLFLVRYKKYQPVTVANNISSKTMAEVEENMDAYPGVVIEPASLREYPEGEYFSHILGYIRKISDTEYAEYKDYGYTVSDIVGKNGIEKLYELDLNGQDGEMLVEVDVYGRRINTIKTLEPVSGKNIYLTLDAELQEAAFNYLEDALTESLISKLLAEDPNDYPISLKQLFISMVESNNISMDEIFNAETGTQSQIKGIILGNHPGLTLSGDEDYAVLKQELSSAIEKNIVSSKQMIYVLIEQGKITADENYLSRIQSGELSPLSVIIQKLEAGELRPSDTNLDPCTGSVVVSDIKTGNVLALVTYPSYDNNRLVNYFDYDYYSKLLNDPTTPLVNRPLNQKKAPGSTFKMVTAIAGLETGAITKNTIIKDEGIFTKASTPYAKCWIYSRSGTTHGSLDVVSALEVSCNYFFYETAFRMGNAVENTTLESITTLNEYMDAFGLNSYTGIEIGESVPNMASPQFKEYTVKWQNPDATVSQTRWTDGDTIRAAIGQSVNNYAPAHINKYVATLANGGIRYKMTIIDKLLNPSGAIEEESLPVVENILEIDKDNLELVHSGMLKVTEGTKGTLRHVFQDFPIEVAAKSGTAEEGQSRNSHTWFTGFAPYDDPQIAVTVMIPFGESSTSPAAVVGKNIIAEYMGLNYTPENNFMTNTLTK